MVSIAAKWANIKMRILKITDIDRVVTRIKWLKARRDELGCFAASRNRRMMSWELRDHRTLTAEWIAYDEFLKNGGKIVNKQGREIIRK